MPEHHSGREALDYNGVEGELALRGPHYLPLQRTLAGVQERLFKMGYPNKGAWIARPATSGILRYGLTMASVGADLALARIFLRCHLREPFTPRGASFHLTLSTNIEAHE